METKIVPVKKKDKIIYLKFACLLIFSNLLTYLMVSPGPTAQNSQMTPENFTRITWPVTSRLSSDTNLNQKINLYSPNKKMIIENAQFIKEENSESGDLKLLTIDVPNSQIDFLLEQTGQEIIAIPSQTLNAEDRSHEVNL